MCLDTERKNKKNSESWILTRQRKIKVQAAERDTQEETKGRQMDRIRNEIVTTKLKVDRILRGIENQHLET